MFLILSLIVGVGVVLEDEVVVEGVSLEEVSVVVVVEEEEGLDMVPQVTLSLPLVNKHQGKRRSMLYLRQDLNPRPQSLLNKIITLPGSYTTRTLLDMKKEKRDPSVIMYFS